MDAQDKRQIKDAHGLIIQALKKIDAVYGNELDRNNFEIQNGREPTYNMTWMLEDTIDRLERVRDVIGDHIGMDNDHGN